MKKSTKFFLVLVTIIMVSTIIGLFTRNTNFILGSFIILFLTVGLFIILNKHIHKAFKFIGITILLLIIIWLGIVLIDYNVSKDLKEPIFAQEVDIIQGRYIYEGLGYSIEFIKEDTIGALSSEYNLYIFDRLFAAWIS